MEERNIRAEAILILKARRKGLHPHDLAIILVEKYPDIAFEDICNAIKDLNRKAPSIILKVEDRFVHAYWLNRQMYT